MGQTPIAGGLTLLVAGLHLYFMALETLWWDTAFGRRTFGTSREQAAATKVLALNQGVYNGFLAAGLFWSLWAGSPAIDMRVFVLSCVVVAGIVGAASVHRKILWIQSLPAALALAAVGLGI